MRPISALRVAIVLVNWNGWRECIECIDSLFGQHHGNFHVFVVDNASSDGSVERLVEWCDAPLAEACWRRHPGVGRFSDREVVGFVPHRVVTQPRQTLIPAADGCQLTIVRAGSNLGFAAGCNVGIKAAGLDDFEYFWFLNPDTVVDCHALTELLRRAEREPGIGMVGSTMRYYHQPEVIQAMGGARLNKMNGTTAHIGQGADMASLPADGAAIEREMSYVMGASMLVTRQFILDVGLMEEDYFLYYEEIDWAVRGGTRFSLGFAPRSHVFHKSGANSSKVMPVFSSGFYYRNRLRFVARFFPNRLRAAKWSLFEGMLRHGIRGRWAQARVVLVTLLNANRITADVTRRS